LGAELIIEDIMICVAQPSPKNLVSVFVFLQLLSNVIEHINKYMYYSFGHDKEGTS